MKHHEEAMAEMRPEEIVLNELMREYKRIADAQSEACKMLDIQIENLTETRQILAEPYQHKLTDIEAQMRLPMLDRQASFVCLFGKINFRKGAVRRTWQLDALDTICANRPEIKDAIWMFREEKTGEPSITVKLAEIGVI